MMATPRMMNMTAKIIKFRAMEFSVLLIFPRTGTLSISIGEGLRFAKIITPVII